MDPRVFDLGDSVKLQHDEFSWFPFGYRLNDVVELPVGTGVSGRWDQQRMIDVRFVGRAASGFVGEFGLSPTASEENSVFSQDRQRVGGDRVSRPRERNRFRDSVLTTSVLDSDQLFVKFRKCFVRDVEVIPRMIPDFETVVMKQFDFLPRHVGFFVRLEREAFRNEKCRSESVLFQNWTSDRKVRLDGVVERQHNDWVLLDVARSLSRGDIRERGNYEKTNEARVPNHGESLRILREHIIRIS